MYSVDAMTLSAAEAHRPVPLTAVFYTLNGVEHGSWVPSGQDRWDCVAQSVGTRLRCEVRAESPPTYDTGTRSWTLELTVFGRRRRPETLSVAVRWR
ncbi:hypothetical protein [Muricoccus radiodurans]|uniref:hypothetical protein n=1 Tax=Muricoccus radiodurans TaxID=2231721 RepID=UPI003CF6626B